MTTSRTSPSRRRPEAPRGRPRLGAAQAGLTLPVAMIMVTLAVVSISTVGFLVTHVRSLAATGDAQRAYYAADGAIEAVLADLVHGADLLAPTYQVPSIELNGVTPVVAVASPPGAARPAPTHQYFDPGVSHPHLGAMTASDGFLLRLPALHPSDGAVTSVLDANWAITVSGAGATGTASIRLLRDAGALTPGRTAGCASGTVVASTTAPFTGPGPAAARLGPIEIADAGPYSLALCVSGTGVDGITTSGFRPTGGPNDTWVYGMAFRDYLVTSRAEGVRLTAYVRQAPGPMQPPAGDWAPNNISWAPNQVTVLEWRLGGE